MRTISRAALIGAAAVAALVAGLVPAGTASASPAAAVKACVTGTGHPDRGADTDEVDPAVAARVQKVLERAADPRAGRRGSTITIPVSVHVLRSSNPARPYADSTMITKTIAKLNQAYSGGESSTSADTHFQFAVSGTPTDTTNTDWDWAEPGTSEERAMKTALHSGDAGTLNLYFVNQTLASQNLGYSTFPWEQADDPILDGVVLNVRAMPGGDFTDYNEGDTATHEVGHWLGLFHTFEGGCMAPGDFVTDTARERTPTNGCPRTKDSCKNMGPSDPIHNFMDYSYDRCMYQFTAGQATRMSQSWAAYRTP